MGALTSNLDRPDRSPPTARPTIDNRPSRDNNPVSQSLLVIFAQRPEDSLTEPIIPVAKPESLREHNLRHLTQNTLVFPHPNLLRPAGTHLGQQKAAVGTQIGSCAVQPPQDVESCLCMLRDLMSGRFQSSFQSKSANTRKGVAPRLLTSSASVPVMAKSRCLACSGIAKIRHVSSLRHGTLVEPRL